MDELAKVLESFQNTYREMQLARNTSPTPPLGSTSAVGNLNIEMKDPTSMGNLVNQAKNNVHSEHSPRSSKKETPRLIRDCLDSQNQLTTLLAQCFLLQRGYGEKAEDAEARDAGFQWLLGRFTIEQARDAFRQYIERHSDMPVPADIINIIDPPKSKPERLSSVEYFRIMKAVSQGMHLWGFDKEFVEEYRKQQRQTVEGIKELEDADKHIAATKPNLEIGYDGDGWQGAMD